MRTVELEVLAMTQQNLSMSVLKARINMASYEILNEYIKY